jgi:hypothetical protein
MPPRILPRDVVIAIDAELPWAKDWQHAIAKRENFKFRAMQIIPGLLRLVERVPDELFGVLSSEENSRFVLAETALREAVAMGRNRDTFSWPNLGDHADCVSVIRSLLHKCPDQVPSASIKQLNFVKEEGLRNTLAVDLGSAERAIPVYEWKTATVLAASVTEALLLWAIQRQPDSDIAAAISGTSNVNKTLPSDNLTDRAWTFHAYIEIAHTLNEIDQRTASRCRDAKDYRNLIHAGAAEREKEECNRATAHGALCAVYAVIKDLEERHQ